MKRSKVMKRAIGELFVDCAVNFRKNYDLPSMIEQILAEDGRILEPLYVRADGMVLKGNRRLSAAKILYADPKTPAGVKNALEKLDVIICTDMTEKEQTTFMLDHGSSKSLTCEETVEALWRLQAEMISGREIMTIMYQLLAAYSNEPQKANEASVLDPGTAREEYLKKWLHGTVDNFLMNAGRMGPFVRRQLILVEIAKDRALTEEEKKEIVFNVTRQRINKLRTAINKDEASGSWDAIAMTGPNFEAEVEKFRIEENKPKTRAASFSKDQMKQTADIMQSDVKLVFLKCAGLLPEADSGKIADLDCRLQRQAKIDSINRAGVDRIDVDQTFTGHQVKALVQAYMAAPAVKYEATFSTFLSPVEESGKSDEAAA